MDFFLRHSDAGETSCRLPSSMRQCFPERTKRCFGGLEDLNSTCIELITSHMLAVINWPSNIFENLYSP